MLPEKVKKCLSRMSGKLSRTVLRRGKGSNPFSLVDYTSNEHHQLLKRYHLEPSMSRPGTPIDNAPMESFFSTKKTEWMPHPEKLTSNQVAVEVENYIQFYNNERIRTNLGMAPLEYRKLVGQIFIIMSQQTVH